MIRQEHALFRGIDCEGPSLQIRGPDLSNQGRELCRVDKVEAGLSLLLDKALAVSLCGFGGAPVCGGIPRDIEVGVSKHTGCREAARTYCNDEVGVSQVLRFIRDRATANDNCSLRYLAPRGEELHKAGISDFRRQFQMSGEVRYYTRWIAGIAKRVIENGASLKP
ncbi:MAG: hypothetical protein GYB36_00935 [Alphaproteobacteria bacterium]|nr:hypothetical protein [Alphaproteobacteria bacterium]